MNRFIKKAKGITLIALVITVIILLIISAVAVSAITGNSGLFSKANEAGTLYNESAKNEANEISELMAWWEDSSVEEKVPEDADVAIKTVNDLIAFREAVNAGDEFLGKKVYLMNDLDLTSISNFGGINRFSGTFDGMGHVISNLKINETNQNAGGLFKTLLADGTIQNLVLNNIDVYGAFTDSSITAGNCRVGGLVGVCHGKVEKCGVASGNVLAEITTTVTPTNWLNVYVGGLVASLQHQSDRAEINECYNFANVEGKVPNTNKYFESKVGGIVGYIGKSISNCYNFGSINGEAYNAYVGGIAGTNGSSTDSTIFGYISNSYNAGLTSATGTVTLTGEINALAYNTSSFKNCYTLNLNKVGANNSKKNEITVGITKTSVDVLKTKASDLGTAFKDDTNNINGGFPILEWQDRAINKTTYTIKNANDFMSFVNDVNSGNSYICKTVYLDNDIDLASVTNFPGISNFSGTFDAKGHKISNLTIDQTNQKYIGLFQIVQIVGNVKNLILENPNIKLTITSNMSNYIGGIAAYTYGKIENCASINGTILMDATGISTNTNMDGYTGGIVGVVNLTGSINKCYNTSNVTAKAKKVHSNICSMAGGITGSNSGSISNCYNTGAIYAEAYRLFSAGICARNSDSADSPVTNCYNAGNVTSSPYSATYDYKGLITGYERRSGVYTNCYMISNGTAAALNESRAEITAGMNKVTEAVLKTKALSLGTAFKDDTNNINNGFPILDWQ